MTTRRRPGSGLGRSLRSRVVLATFAAVTVASVVMVLAATVLIGRAVDRDADRALADRIDAALSTLTVADGQVDVENIPGEAALDGGVWVYTPDGVLVRGAGGPQVQAAADELGATPGAAGPVDVPDASIRLASEPYLHGGTQVGTVVAALSMEAYQRATRIFTGILIFLDLLVIALATTLAGLLARIALRPVLTMTEQAALWGEHDLDARFALGHPHDEITQLGATLDGLLARISASLRHERRFSAEVSHELRTPLSVVLAEAEIAVRHPQSEADARASFEVVRNEAQRMQAIIDTLVQAAARETDPRVAVSDLRALLTALANAWELPARSSGRELVVAAPEQDAVLGVDAEIVARILGPIMDNALRHARAHVQVTATVDGSVTISVGDDGPGVAPDRGGAIFDPGRRGDSPAGGSGLGLPLARRLARAVAGDVTLRVGNHSGAWLDVTLPRG